MKEVKRYIGEMANMFGIPMELYTMRRGVKEKGKLLLNKVKINFPLNFSS